MIEILTILAQAAPVTGGISPGDVGQIIAGLLVGIGFGGGGALVVRKIRASTTIDGQPLRTKGEPEYALQRDLDILRADMARENAKLDGMMARVLDRMDERDKQLRSAIHDTAVSLSASIEKVAKGAGEGRVRIWDALRDVEKDVAAVAGAAGVRRIQKSPRGEG